MYLSVTNNRAITAPLDTIKIRLQLLQLHSPSSSGTQAISKILREEGIRALWKGNVPAEYLYILYGGAQFTSYSALNHQFNEFQKSHGFSLSQLTHSFIVGCGVGVLSTVVTYPFDLLRTRLAAHESKHFLSMSGTIREIYKQNGISGFYVGLQPSLLSIVASSGFFFWSYALARSATEVLPVEHVWGVEAMCGFVAGTTAKALSFPLDTIRKRAQIVQPSSVIQMLFLNWKNHGILGFYRGFFFSLLKTAPTSAISMAVYEYVISAGRNLPRL